MPNAKSNIQKSNQQNKNTTNDIKVAKSSFCLIFMILYRFSLFLPCFCYNLKMFFFACNFFARFWHTTQPKMPF